MKRCAHYDLEGSAVSADAACDEIIKLRKAQLEACETDLLECINTVMLSTLTRLYRFSHVAQGSLLRSQLLDLDPSLQNNNRFSDWLKGLEKPSKEGCGDHDALERIRSLVEALDDAMVEDKTGKCKLKCADPGGSC